MTAATQAAGRLAELAPMPDTAAPDQALILARQFAVGAQRSLRRLEHGDGPAADKAARLYAQYAALAMLCAVWDKDPAAADNMARAIRDTAEDRLTGHVHDILTALGISPAEVDELDDIVRQDEDRQHAALGPDRARTAAFHVTAGDEGGLIVSAPCADTIGCLWTALLGSHATLGELNTTAAAHTGQAAGDLHATLAGLVTAPDGLNDGRPVLHSAAGGWVCAVPHPGNPDDICGTPVSSQPCPLHPASRKEPAP